MPDLLNTSLTGLRAFQLALATTSNNIANVNTEGYSRQRVNFGTMPAQNVGVGYIGRGVQPQGVVRILDQFRVDSLRNNLTEESRLTALNGMAGGIDSLLASPDSGLSQPMQDFFSALQTVADNPSSVSARQVALSQAEVLADRFSTLDSRLTGLNGEVTARLQSSLTQVNTLAANVADLNLAIRDAEAAAGGAPANDLLDQRDVVLNQLAEQIAIDVVPQNDGSVSVFVGSGQALVLGPDSNELALVGGDFPAANAEIALVTATGGNVILPDVQGGEIGGLLDFRREMLNPTQNTLGQLATAVTSALNEQNSLGMDLDGNLGGDIFSLGQPVVYGASSNTGTGAVDLTVADVGGLTNTDYLLAFDGGSYTLTRSDTGAAVALAGTGTALDPFVADGLEIVVTSPPAAGDSFLLRPTAEAAGTFTVALTDPRALAAALPVVASGPLSNAGTGSIQGETILDPSDPNLLDSVTIEFTGPATFSVNGAGSFAYTAGADIDINGWRVNISGAPEVGDQFTVTSNAGGVGDNRNAQALTAAFDGGILAGGNVSVRERFESLVSEVATETRRSGINLTAQTAITERALNDQLATSGVNLDEEAANMLRFQQAYQASAQMISVADTLFRTLGSRIVSP
ncbi:MAG: flagellar hook-associated protein FlgK [Pseudomonadota bacterium]